VELDRLVVMTVLVRVGVFMFVVMMMLMDVSVMAVIMGMLFIAPVPGSRRSAYQR